MRTLIVDSEFDSGQITALRNVKTLVPETRQRSVLNRRGEWNWVPFRIPFKSVNTPRPESLLPKPKGHERVHNGSRAI